ncbi:MAG: recombinase RecA [Candidatus Njordarchaeia archaeon]
MARKKKNVSTTTSSTLKALPTELKLVFNELEKHYGKGCILRLGEGIKFFGTKKQFSTGSLALDIALGIFYKDEREKIQHGLPAGRIVEIFGAESTGKSTLCNHIIASAQKKGEWCAFLDMEQAWDKVYAQKIGVDVDNLLLSQPNCAEECLKTLELLLKTGKLGVIVVDSVASLVPRAEFEGGIDDQQMGLQARLMSKALRKLNPIINSSNTLVVFTNQIREKVGIMFGNPQVTPGGNALKFYSSIRLEIKKTNVIKGDNGSIVGHHGNIKVVKNKLAPPFRTAEIDMLYGIGVDPYYDLINSALDLGIIERKGSWFSYGGTQLAQGKENLRDFFKEDIPFFEQVKQDVVETVYNQINLIPPTEEEIQHEEKTQQLPTEKGSIENSSGDVSDPQGDVSSEQSDTGVSDKD